MKDKSKGRIAKPVPQKPNVQLRKTPAPVVQESAIAVAEPSKEERSALEIDPRTKNAIPSTKGSL